jgi:hypothetical protein
MSRPRPPADDPLAQADTFAVDIALRLLPVCATLAALCLAGLAYLEAVAPEAVTNTLADEVLGIAGFLFLVDIYLIIWTQRRGPTRRARRSAHVASILFAVAMTIMMADGAYFFFVVHRDQWTTQPSARTEPDARQRERHRREDA